MTVAVATGWLVALLAAGAAWRARRELARRSEVAARACHEVRGPLTALGLGLSTAGDRPLSAEELRGLETELGRGALAVRDLAAAWSGGRSGERPQSVSMAQLIADVVAAAGSGAEGAEVALCGDWAGEDAVVIGQRLRLAQALSNLVANAVEHGGGAVSVRGRLRGGTQARIEVCDEGPGLPAPIAWLAGRAHAGHGGRGRGIAIASTIVRDHGGGLSTAPAPRGARLVLTLPAVDARVARRA